MKLILMEIGPLVYASSILMEIMFVKEFSVLSLITNRCFTIKC